MTSLDLLFWLLIGLLAGVAWAVEAGLTMRHRNVLLASTLSSFASVVFIMFWIDDKSVLQLAERPKTVKVNGSGDEEPGAFELEKKKGEKSGAGDKGGTTAKIGDADDDDTLEYSRAPFRDCATCPEIVIVTPKTAAKGANTPFAVGRLELLRAEFAAFVQARNYKGTSENCDVPGGSRSKKYSWRNPGFEQDGRHPVVCVTPLDADAYIEWLSAQSGRSYRLLSEGEADYVASGGPEDVDASLEALTAKRANFGRLRDGTIAGGSLTANALGISDVNGNVWEILRACHVVQSGNNAACTDRIVRGGGWNSTIDQLKSTSTVSLPSTNSANFIGFRVARDVDKADDVRILSKEQKAALRAETAAAAEMSQKSRAAADQATRDKLEADYKAEQTRIETEAKKVADEVAKKAADAAAAATPKKK